MPCVEGGVTLMSMRDEVVGRPAGPATDVYARFVRDVVSPYLRRHGCQGSAGRYRLKDAGEDHALIAFQRDRYSNPREVSFTINLTYISAEAWTEARREDHWLPARPNGMAVEPARGWYERIGMLEDPPSDRWWSLRANEDVPDVAEHVLRLLRDGAIPELRRRITRDPIARASQP